LLRLCTVYVRAPLPGDGVARNANTQGGQVAPQLRGQLVQRFAFPPE